MCGIVGIAGPGINSWDLDVLRELSYVCGLRGMDSTGVFQGRSNSDGKIENLIIEKSVLDVSFFMQFHKRYDGGNKKVLEGVYNNFFCVHTRAATRGQIIPANAHPFDFENVVGCHNGTLADVKYMDKDKTDSEMMIKDINKRGPKAVLQDLSPSSAYVVVLLDKKTGELVFVRNDQRPLYVCFHAHRAVMYWASERWMLESIMARNREQIFKNDIRFFEPHHVYRVHPANDIQAGTDKVFTKEKFTPKTWGTAGNSRYNWHGVWDQESLDAWTERENSKKKERQDTSEKCKDSKDVKLETKDEKKDDKKDVVNSEVILQQQSKRLPPHLSLVPRPRSRVTIVRSNFNNENKVPLYHCCACQEKMSLVEQYFATKLGEKTFIHKKCQDFPGNIESQEERLGL